jgi:agmatinase
MFAKEHTFLNKFDLSGLSEAIEMLKGRPVYFTLALDVLDSSVLPGTGTPEAGGLSFNELLQAVTAIGRLNIVGCDMVELSPPCDKSGASTALACKLLRELLISTYK